MEHSPYRSLYRKILQSLRSLRMTGENLHSQQKTHPPAAQDTCAAGGNRSDQRSDQNAMRSSIQLLSWSMGTRTCSMVSRSRMVTALSAGVFSSPTVSKSTVMQ